MKNWGSEKIVDISTVFEDGDWIESKDQSAEGIRLIQTGNVGNGIFKDRGEKARYISEDTFKKLRCTEIFEGDCLISRLPDPVGRACILPNTGEKMITAVDCTIIRFDQKQLISNWFLYYSLSNEYQNEIQKQVTGATRQRISRKNLGLVSVPLPSLPEQQRIVSLLDEAFAAIAKAKANAEQNLKNAKELFESYLQGMFEKKGNGWVEKTLEELADEKCTLSYGIVQPGEEFENGLPVIRPTDLTSRYIKLEGLKRIDPKLADGYKRTKLIGDELLLCVRGTTGVVSIATPELKDANVTRGIVPIRFNPKILNQEFGYYLLISNYVQKQIRAKTYGAALMQINIGDLRKILTPYPPIQEQQTIVRQLDALRAETQKLEAVYQKKIADLEELKKSILQKAFAGELRTSENIRTYSSESEEPIKLAAEPVTKYQTQ